MLVVVKEDSLLPEFLSENPVLCQQVLDGVLLSAIDPVREDQEQQLPRLQSRSHLDSNADLNEKSSIRSLNSGVNQK